MCASTTSRELVSPLRIAAARSVADRSVSELVVGACTAMRTNVPGLREDRLFVVAEMHAGRVYAAR